MKPRCNALPRIKLDSGQWGENTRRGSSAARLQYEATFKGQVTTCVELATDREKRAASREACWGITPPTVDEVLDLILSAARARHLAKTGSRRRCLGLVAGPWRSSYNHCLQAFVCKELCPSCGKEVSWQPFRVERIRREELC